jgi:glycosidase
MAKKLHIIEGALFVALLFLLSGCRNNEDVRLAKKPEITGMATPVFLQTDSTVIQLGDYFLHPKNIDSVLTNNLFTCRISPDSMEMTMIPKEKNFPRLSVMKVWIDGFSYSLLLEKSRKIWQHVAFDPKDKKVKSVAIAGDMNDWMPSKTPLHMNQKDGKWQTEILLFPGKYQYKFVVDGKWILDPANPESIDNNVGGYNSVMKAGLINPPAAPFLYTNKLDGRKITIGIKNKVKEFFVFWQNIRLDEKFCKEDSSGLTIQIPKKAKEFDRSFIRVWAYNPTGSSNEILVPLGDGKVITDAKKLTRQDKETMIIYFLMVDRFRDGNVKNDLPVKDKDVDPKLNFMGGDLAGITQKIDSGYFKELGVNTLWISPITQNPPDAWAEYPAPHRKFTGYHGYWPVTLTTVDNHFGTADDLKGMVKAAHNNDMNVLLDFVSNHVHQTSKIYKQHPDWATPLILPNKQKNIRLWNEQRFTTWFDTFLPTLDLTKPEVAEMMSDSALYWIKTYEFDGFRHDACKHIPEVYWRLLTKKLKDQVIVGENYPVYQIGESFGSRDLISGYVNPGMLDAQFEFDLYFDSRNVFVKDNGSFKDLNYSLQESFSYFGEHSLMGNITGNQDMARFISYASGAMSFSDDDHEFGWKNNVVVKDTVGYSKLASLLAFNMTIPGVPVIYYGDEFGMPGANDPDNRRMMEFSHLTPQEVRMKGVTEKLIHLRNTNLPLIYGEFKTIEVSDKVFVYMRTYFDKVVFVIFNKDKAPKKIDFDVPDRFAGMKLVNNFGSDAKLDKNKITLTLKGNSFEIITRE